MVFFLIFRLEYLEGPMESFINSLDPFMAVAIALVSKFCIIAIVRALYIKLAKENGCSRPAWILIGFVLCRMADLIPIPSRVVPHQMHQDIVADDCMVVIALVCLIVTRLITARKNKAAVPLTVL